MNDMNHSARFDIEITKDDIVYALADEYGVEFRFAIKGIDLDNKKVLTYQDGTYAVNAFELTLKNGKLRATVADMPELEF